MRSFNDFGDRVGHKLGHVYASPDDIDLWVGGLLEQSHNEALLGPTFSDIIADQFTRFRRGDRYFYEHHPSINPGAFSEAQLHELRRTTLAKMICLNSDHIHEFSPNAFKQPHVHGNRPVNCDSLPGINLGAWKE